MAESRNGSFYEGKTPTLLDVHEAYTSGKIPMEEAQDLNVKYDPSKVTNVFKRGDTKYVQKRTQAHMLNSVLKQKKLGKGRYAKKKDDND
jgi:hypothetical protein